MAQPKSGDALPRDRRHLLVFVAAGCQTVGKNVVGDPELRDGRRRALPVRAAERGGSRQLKIQGVRTVIDLRDDRNPPERSGSSCGHGYVNIRAQRDRVEPAKIATFLKEVERRSRSSSM